MDFSIPDWLSEEHSLGVFLLVSVAMGGGAAWLAGRAIAADLASGVARCLLYAHPSLAVRFIHYALFGGNFLSLHYYLVDFAVCLGFGYLGFRLMRVRQMVTRYSWINQRTGLFTWRRSDNATAADKSKSQ